MSQANIAIVRRWFDEVWNQHNLDTVKELLTEDSVCYTDEGPIQGPDEFLRRQYIPFMAAFPELRVNVEAAIADGNDVVVRWTAAGIHAGDGLGFPATHKKLDFRGISWIQLRDGKFLDGWQSSNIIDVLRDLAEDAELTEPEPA